MFVQFFFFYKIQILNALGISLNGATSHLSTKGFSSQLFFGRWDIPACGHHRADTCRVHTGRSCSSIYPCKPGSMSTKENI